MTHAAAGRRLQVRRRRPPHFTLTAALVIISTWPAVAADFTCHVEHVTDGDTFRCAGGVRIRLAGIDAPEIDTRQGPPSRDALAALIAGRDLVCTPSGTSYNRIVATCLLDGRDIAAAMVEQAQARDCPRYSGGTYAALEDARHLALPIGTFCTP